MSTTPSGTAATKGPDRIDANLERIMNAAGSSLRHYMPSSKDKLREAMAEVEVTHLATIEALVGALEITRAMIHGEIIENAIVDVDIDPMQSLGQTIDRALSLVRGDR